MKERSQLSQWALIGQLQEVKVKKKRTRTIFNGLWKAKMFRENSQRQYFAQDQILRAFYKKNLQYIPPIVLGYFLQQNGNWNLALSARGVSNIGVSVEAKIDVKKQGAKACNPQKSIKKPKSGQKCKLSFL